MSDQYTLFLDRHAKNLWGPPSFLLFVWFINRILPQLWVKVATIPIIIIFIAKPSLVILRATKKITKKYRNLIVKSEIWLQRLKSNVYTVKAHSIQLYQYIQCFKSTKLSIYMVWYTQSGSCCNGSLFHSQSFYWENHLENTHMQNSSSGKIVSHYERK